MAMNDALGETYLITSDRRSQNVQPGFLYNSLNKIPIFDVFTVEGQDLALSRTVIIASTHCEHSELPLNSLHGQKKNRAKSNTSYSNFTTFGIIAVKTELVLNELIIFLPEMEVFLTNRVMLSSDKISLI